MESHDLGNLAGIELAVGFIPGIGRAGSAAFVQVDAVSLNKPPALWQHPVGGQLRRGGEGGVALANSCIGHQGQNLREAVFIQIILRKGSRKIMGYDPKAVVQREALTYIDDSFGVINAQAEGLENLGNIGAVFGNHPPPQPL